ncbi:MAG: HTTM domain-containing protein [Sandaracinaceae bacterium]
MRWLERTLFVPVAAVRPYLALKLTLPLLALDMWLTRASHGGRYGAGGFNVAHFHWLDAIQPAVSPAMYVGLSVLTGALCFMIALARRPPRWLIGIAFVLHTWSWAMSMLDSYQHHYLLSIVLLAMVFFPPLSAEEALGVPPQPAALKRTKKKRKPQAKNPEPSAPILTAPAPHTSAWAYVMLCMSTGMVYAYTAYAKTDPEWLSGAALKRVLHLSDSGLPSPGQLDPMGPFRGILEVVGLEGDALFAVLGHSVVLVQIICAAGFVLAPFLDVSRHWLPHVFSVFAMVTALSFHLGAEYMGLQIGWFSWYMVGYAMLFMLPSRVVVTAARVVVPVRGTRIEVLAVRIALALALIGLGLTAASWTQRSPFGVSLSGIFGDGPNVPLTLLGGVVLALTPLRLFARIDDNAAGPSPDTSTRVALVTVALGAGALLFAGKQADLPGARWAGVLAATGLGVAVIVAFLRGTSFTTLQGYGVGALVGSLALWASLSYSEVRWDYYRNVGGDHRRRGEILEAYNAYVLANRYAPRSDLACSSDADCEPREHCREGRCGQDRLERQREMEAQLRATGQLP